jgi:hypothetical protein
MFIDLQELYDQLSARYLEYLNSITIKWQERKNINIYIYIYIYIFIRS